MRNGHASVTHNVTCESQPPVPSHPYPARPALYRSEWSSNTTSSSYVSASYRDGVVSK